MMNTIDVWNYDIRGREFRLCYSLTEIPLHMQRYEAVHDISRTVLLQYVQISRKY